MRIKQVDFNIDVTNEYGLLPVKMARLGQVVLIAGKNGSGKSRFLQLLTERVKMYPNLEREILSKEGINSSNNHILALERGINATEKKLTSNLNNEDEKIQIERFRNSISSNLIEIDDHNKILEIKNQLTFLGDKIDNYIVNFMPKSLSLKDTYNIAPSEADKKALLINNLGTEGCAESTIPAIEKIVKQWVNINTVVTDDLNVTKEEKKQINDSYERLKKYIKIFLDTDLKRDSDGPLLFGKRIGKANLSDGQKILLQLCVALYAQETKLSDLVIIMDEPENHLHPAVLLEAIDKITAQIPNGQLWIGTHSINILAHFDPACIWFMDAGLLSYAGQLPDKVLRSLLGNDDEMQKLSNFLSLPAELASIKFAYESLLIPEVVVTGPDDPQIRQIREIIRERVEEGNKLKVLDFGMGKGRLVSAIIESERLEGRKVVDWLDYYGFDIDSTNKELCLKILEEGYDNFNDRYFNNENSILERINGGSLDLIIMCNVFHEIDPKHWLELFKGRNSLMQLLKTEGKLIIIEDQFLSIGEKAHSNGFMVFSEREFKKLFNIPPEDKSYVSLDYRGDGKLKSHHIPKNFIDNITQDSKIESIQILRTNAMASLRRIREEVPSYKKGHMHGFWSQQLANASLVLEEIG
jgi:ABC-type cobalamin/Fe3+-siderophores transport system ATPase subunit